LGLTVGYVLFRSGDEEVVVLDNPCACAWYLYLLLFSFH
jgi:copper transporter 1